MNDAVDALGYALGGFSTKELKHEPDPYWGSEQMQKDMEDFQDRVMKAIAQGIAIPQHSLRDPFDPGIPKISPCSHTETVDVGFMHSKIVCKKCNTEIK